jgi:hypothetical protein
VKRVIWDEINSKTRCNKKKRGIETLGAHGANVGAWNWKTTIGSNVMTGLQYQMTEEDDGRISVVQGGTCKEHCGLPLHSCTIPLTKGKDVSCLLLDG